MARNNYQYEKRQRDIAKKKKQDEKRQKKLNKSSGAGDDNPDNYSDDIENREDTEINDEKTE